MYISRSLGTYSPGPVTVAGLGRSSPVTCGGGVGWARAASNDLSTSITGVGEAADVISARGAAEAPWAGGKASRQRA